MLDERPQLAGLARRLQRGYSKSIADFNVQGLRPILREDDSDRYILRDAEGIYYLWELWDGHLLRVGEHWVKGPHLHTVEDVVGNILCELTWVEQDSQRVYKTDSQKKQCGTES